jgi:hypothetical protein
MGKKNRDSTKTDFSSFMCIILMLTGCLVTIMVANIMIISANPDNITITSVIGLSDFSDGNVTKDANYIDVYRDRLDLYFDQGNRMESVPISDLEAKGNKLDQFIDTVSAVKDTQYIVMLVRPDSADIYRRLRSAIRARKIDLGMELFENNQTVFFKDGMVAEKTGR